MSPRFPTHNSVLAAIQAAEEVRGRGDWAAALDAYAAILHGRLVDLNSTAATTGFAGEFRAVDLVVVERLADLAVPFGHHRAADQLLEGYVGLAAGAGNLMAADYAALKRVRLALGHDSIGEAVARLEAMEGSIGNLHDIALNPTALPKWEEARPWSRLEPADQAVLYSRLYLELGRLFASLGQYADGLGAFDRGLRHATAPDAPDLARRAETPLRLDRASALLEQGALAEAREALAGVEALPSLRDEPDAAIHVAELAGKLAALTGDLGEAQRRFEGIVRDCRARGFHRAAAVAALNLAHLLISLNQTARARKLIAGAIGEGKDDGDGDGDVLSTRARLLAGLAGARGTSLAGGVAIAPAVTQLWGGRGAGPQAGPGPAAAAVAALGLDDPPQPTNYLAFFEDQALGFLSRLASGEPEAAARALDRLDQVFGATDSALIQLRLRALRGLSDYYLDRHEEAAERLAAAAEELARLGLRPELWQTLRVLGWSLRKLGHPAVETEDLTERAQRLLDEMTRTLSEEDRPILLLNKWTSEEETIVSRIERLTRQREDVEKSPWPIRLWKRWVLWKRLDELLRFLDRFKVDEHHQKVGVAGRSGGGPEPVPVPLWRRLLGHPWRRAVLSFVVLPDRVFLACSRWGRLDFGVSPVTRLQVREKVKAWYEAVGQSDDPSGLLEADAALADLARSLQFGPLLDRLGSGVRALTIVPDDSLHGFPFAALKHRGAFLIENYALTLGVAREPGAPRRTVEGASGALLVGVSRGSGPIPRLDGVARELDAVQVALAKRGAEVVRLEDDRADRSAVLKELGIRRVAHIACHGVFRTDQPNASGLVLIPAPGRVEYLSLEALARVDLSNLSHLTLSACWSADAFILPGRRVISLPETLCRSGVGSVLGSLWPVDDATASALMDRFYEGLDDHPADEALRRAQLAMIRGTASDDRFAAHPVAWSGYTLTGRADRIRAR